MVNNAGNLLHKPFVPLPRVHKAHDGFDTAVGDEEWDGVMDVHLGGAVRMLRAFGPGIENGSGRVVNVVRNVVRRTVLSLRRTARPKVPSSSSPGRSPANGGRYGVTVNAVAAGHFPTRMSHEQFEDPESLQRLLRRVPSDAQGSRKSSPTWPAICAATARPT